MPARCGAAAALLRAGGALSGAEIAAAGQPRAVAKCGGEMMVYITCDATPPETRAFELSSDACVRDLRDIVQEWQGPRWLHCELSYSGAVLGDDAVPLADLGIGSEATVHARPRSHARLRAELLVGKQLGTDGMTSYTALAISPDGLYCVAALGKLRVFNLTDGTTDVIELSDSQPHSVAIAQDYTLYAAVRGSGSKVLAFKGDPRTGWGAPEEVMEFAGNLGALVCPESGGCYIFGDDGGGVLVSVPDGKRTELAGPGTTDIRGACSIGPDKIALVHNSASRVVVLSTVTGKELYTIGRSLPSPHGRLYYPQDATSDGFGGMFIADGANNRLVHTGEDGNVLGVALTNADSDGSIDWPWAIAMRAGSLVAGHQNSGLVHYTEDPDKEVSRPAFTEAGASGRPQLTDSEDDGGSSSASS
eukprot:TRINITY_DN10003_c0_g1_i1.p1 TRINITY_DN10003_c0_g1~~TRINITY_DN10003_c0_g1_i1.p1  ORF type:complete len:446 (+),score=71.62 TRINITY_DN10003_c0_g1_i1:83-1339(+)